MKKYISFLVCIVLFSSCQKGKQEIVKDLLSAVNENNKELIEQILVDDFMFYANDTLNKDEYLSKVDFVHSFEYQIQLLSLQNQDSIVKTTERAHNLADSLLEVSPTVIYKKTYRFLDDKLISITIDSALNYEEHLKSYNEKFLPFVCFVSYQYNINIETELFVNIKKYLLEYSKLPPSDKRRYRNYGYLDQGIYESNDSPFYKALIFQGKRTVTVIDGFIGFPYSTSYDLDEDIIKVKTDQGELLFVIQDSQTLIGEGFAKGTYRKTNY